MSALYVNVCRLRMPNIMSLAIMF